MLASSQEEAERHELIKQLETQQHRRSREPKFVQEQPAAGMRAEAFENCAGTRARGAPVQVGFHALG